MLGGGDLGGGAGHHDGEAMMRRRIDVVFSIDAQLPVPVSGIDATFKELPVQHYAPHTLCTVSVGPREQRTKVCKHSAAPEWKETMVFTLPLGVDMYGRPEIDAEAEVRVMVHKREILTHNADTLLGSAEINLQELWRKAEEKPLVQPPASAASGGGEEARRGAGGGEEKRGGGKEQNSDWIRTGMKTFSIRLPLTFNAFRNFSSDKGEGGVVVLSGRFDEYLQAVSADREHEAECVQMHHTQVGWGLEERLLWRLCPQKGIVVQQQKDGVGEVQVVVMQAQNLLASDPDGFSDPFVQIQVGDVIGKTQVKRKTLNAVYNEAFLFEHPLATKDIQLTVFDWDPPDTVQEIGRVVVPISSLAQDQSLCQWHSLFMGPIFAGELLLLIRVLKKPSPPHPGYVINSVHVTKERSPNEAYRTAMVRKQQFAQEMTERERERAREGGRQLKEELLVHLDDHALLVMGSCAVHSKQCKKEQALKYGLQHWLRTRGFLWKLNRGSFEDPANPDAWRRSLVVCELGILSYYVCNRPSHLPRELVVMPVRPSPSREPEYCSPPPSLLHTSSREGVCGVGVGEGVSVGGGVGKGVEGVGGGAGGGASASEKLQTPGICPGVGSTGILGSKFAAPELKKSQMLLVTLLECRDIEFVHRFHPGMPLPPPRKESDMDPAFSMIEDPQEGRGGGEAGVTLACEAKAPGLTRAQSSGPPATRAPQRSGPGVATPAPNTPRPRPLMGGRLIGPATAKMTDMFVSKARRLSDGGGVGGEGWRRGDGEEEQEGGGIAGGCEAAPISTQEACVSDEGEGGGEYCGFPHALRIITKADPAVLTGKSMGLRANLILAAGMPVRLGIFTSLRSLLTSLLHSGCR